MKLERVEGRVQHGLWLLIQSSWGWEVEREERENDAEHPMDTTMNPSSNPQAPCGLMTRARVRAIDTEVTSYMSFLYLHMRHRCYLTQEPYTYLGVMETSLEK